MGVRLLVHPVSSALVGVGRTVCFAARRSGEVELKAPRVSKAALLSGATIKQVAVGTKENERIEPQRTPAYTGS